MAVCRKVERWKAALCFYKNNIIIKRKYGGCINYSIHRRSKSLQTFSPIIYIDNMINNIISKKG